MSDDIGTLFACPGRVAIYMLSRTATLSACSVLWLACATAPVQVVEPGVRTVVYRPGRTIREQLLPSDRVVEVVFDADTSVDEGPPATPKEELRRLLKSVPTTALAVVIVTDQASSLTDDGAWIDTILKVTVRDVLRATAESGLPLKAGDTVAVRASGGETVVDGVTVRTDVRPHFALTQPYLLALGNRDTAGRWGNSLGIALAVGPRERLTPLHALHHRLTGVSLAEVRDVLRDPL